MPKRMLIDATHAEETRVAVVDHHLRLEHLDIVHAGREPLKGNIYLAKVKRIEPSLQAAFVEYGGNRHGFLPFAEIHPDYFRIPVADREALMQRIAAAEARLEQGEDPLPHIAQAIEEQAAASTDPFQPIVLDDSGGFGATLDTGLVKLTDASEAPLDDAENTAADNLQAVTALPLEVDDNEDALDEDVGEDDVETPDADVPAVANSNYETVGGGEDEMGEMRQRIRRQFLRNYRIQEVIKRGQVMLIQVVKEERGNKGAALTSYLSLAGRYSVLMPNSDKSGGVSRKISNMGDRRRLKEIIDMLEVPQGMSVILRTAGLERTEEEIKRDFDYLVRLWDQIREDTLASTAPALIYEEANLIKRAIRDYYSRDTDGIVVEGEGGYKLATDFMKILMPDHVSRVVHYSDPNVSLFSRYQIENQIERLYQPVVQLKSGGYIVINPTEALVAIDVNSGRATRDRHIEETALRTNLEASDEIARQLRLRDLAGLVVVDYIDMEDYKHNHQVERRLKEAMRFDRARLQIGRISPFGLLELSRQRLRPSLLETNYEKCSQCGGAGHVRSTDSAALSVLRAIAEEGLKQKATEIAVFVPTPIATYILNHKRTAVEGLERRFGLNVFFKNDDKLAIAEHRIERLKAREGEPLVKAPETTSPGKIFSEHAAQLGLQPLSAEDLVGADIAGPAADDEEGGSRRGRRDRGRRDKRRRGRNRNDGVDAASAADDAGSAKETEVANADNEPNGNVAANDAVGGEAQEGRGDRRDGRRRRGRRGGRNRDRNREGREGSRTPREVPDNIGNIAPPVANGDPFDTTPRDESRVAQAYAPTAPASVYDIDTTPKEGADAPKAGWWRKWTN
ncbi:MAG: ribonuclease E/G [Bdellovibrionales bacterium]